MNSKLQMQMKEVLRKPKYQSAHALRELKKDVLKVLDKGGVILVESDDVLITAYKYSKMKRRQNLREFEEIRKNICEFEEKIHSIQKKIEEIEHYKTINENKKNERQIERSRRFDAYFRDDPVERVEGKLSQRRYQ